MTEAKKQILTVEDDESLQELVVEMIHSIIPSEKVDVTVCADGQQGLKKSLSQKYDLIITDISMPNVNGLDFIRQTHWNETNQSTPIIVVSGFLDSFNNKIEKIEFENVQFVEKPINYKSLTRIIKMCLKV